MKILRADPSGARIAFANAAAVEAPRHGWKLLAERQLQLIAKK